MRIDYERKSNTTAHRWTPEAYDALIELINKHGINSEGYDPERPPLVALDCDGTLILNDVGEALMRFLVNRRQINGDRRFWQSLVPENLGRDALAVAIRSQVVEIQRCTKQRHTDDSEPDLWAHETLKDSGLEAAWPRRDLSEDCTEKQ